MMRGLPQASTLPVPAPDSPKVMYDRLNTLLVKNWALHRPSAAPTPIRAFMSQSVGGRQIGGARGAEVDRADIGFENVADQVQLAGERLIEGRRHPDLPLGRVGHLRTVEVEVGQYRVVLDLEIGVLGVEVTGIDSERERCRDAHSESLLKPPGARRLGIHDRQNDCARILR